MGPSYTFEPQKSTLDYILIPNASLDLINKCVIVDNDKRSIASDNLPIFASVNVPSNRFLRHLPNRHLPGTKLLMTGFIQTPQTPDEIEKFNKILTDTLINLAKETIPQKKFNPHTKPYWNKKLNDSHTIAR